MAHFYGDMKGNRKEVTRCGSKSSGIDAHIRGWNIGVSINMYVDSEGRDTIDIYKTSGSNSNQMDILITQLTNIGEDE